MGELPPRARRILFYLHGFMHNGGTTSACAENTCCGCGDRFGVRNYLRVRGEYQRGSPSRYPHQELPPRARRIHPPTNQAGGLFGTTSACAENTKPMGHMGPRYRNYLRVRGEYPPNPKVTNSTLELPPRARRIFVIKSRKPGGLGTTSACAENTVCSWWKKGLNRNYLRVRGEYTSGIISVVSSMELPPRARRILPAFTDSIPDNGTTSACAENTANSRPARSPAWNYLRVRGEYLIENHGIGPSLELPPRARRILQGGVTWATGHGTTSACAENTETSSIGGM